MATVVYKQEEITLQDGTDVVLRPLAIGRLRRFMEAWATFDKLEDGDDGFDIFINCAGIALEDSYKGKFDSLKASKDERENGEFLSAEYKEYLEDTLDLDSIYRIIEVCSGIKLNDPKVIQAAEAAVEELGKS